MILFTCFLYNASKTIFGFSSDVGASVLVFVYVLSHSIFSTSFNFLISVRHESPIGPLNPVDIHGYQVI